MKTVEIGQRVFVSPKVNSVWTGEGVVERVSTIDGESLAIVRMTSGRQTGVTGFFEVSELESISGMKIVSIKRSNAQDRAESLWQGVGRIWKRIQTSRTSVARIFAAGFALAKVSFSICSRRIATASISALCAVKSGVSAHRFILCRPFYHHRES